MDDVLASLNIVHIAHGNHSGAPYRLTQVQQDQGQHARLIVGCGPGSLKNWAQDVSNENRDELAGLLSAADVVHYHGKWRANSFFVNCPWALELVRHKPSLLQIHGPREEQDEDLENALNEPGLIPLICAQYQVRQYPEFIPVPLAIPINDPLYVPFYEDNRPVSICFTPSNTDDVPGWRNKGCSATLAILQRGFNYAYCHGTTWQQAMAVRQRCDIAIDEVMTGSYHTTSLEAMSQGLATIAGLDALTVDALESVTGTREHPWIVASIDQLEAALLELVSDHAMRLARQQQSRAYMEKYWRPGVVVNRFNQVYRMALEQVAV